MTKHEEPILASFPPPGLIVKRLLIARVPPASLCEHMPNGLSPSLTVGMDERKLIQLFGLPVDLVYIDTPHFPSWQRT